jgi:kumamolisin
MAEYQRYVAVPGSEREPLAGAVEIGPTDPNSELSVTVLVRRRPDSELSALVEEQAAKPLNERRYLSREELASQHGADPNDLRKVEEFATQHGLTVVKSDPATRTVGLRGRAADFSSAFRVNLADYRYGGGTYRVRTGPVSVPAELAGVVEAVLGLDNRPQAAPRVVVPAEPIAIVAPSVAAAFTPVEVAQLYQFPTGVTGQGQSVGIIELGGGYTASDLSTFFQNLGLQVPTVVAVSVDGAQNSPSQPPAGADFEVELDIQVIGAVAPGVRIAVYFAPNTDQGFLDAITTAIQDTTNNPSVISISWGSPESNWTGQSMQAFEQRFQDAAAVGVSVFCASGDNGSTDGVTDGLQHVDFPASAPHAVGCGGTHLEATGTTISSEVVWSGSGGGVSDQFGLPTWQNGVGVPPSANPGHRVGRGVPDVGGDADPATGYKIVVGGTTTAVGGTSAVSPLWSGLTALLNQALGKHLGFVNPLFYTPAERATFGDITSGSNGAYSAAPGWDACTGLGTPRGQALLQALRGG